jgi:hypothetical protein
VKTTIEVGDLVKRYGMEGWGDDQTIYLVAEVAPDGEWVHLVGAGTDMFAARSLMVLSKVNDSRDLDPKKYFK